MNKKDILIIVVKVLIYALTLIAGYLGVTSLSSCSVNRSLQHRGVGYIQYYDTLTYKSDNIYINKYGRYIK